MENITVKINVTKLKTKNCKKTVLVNIELLRRSKVICQDLKSIYTPEMIMCEYSAKQMYAID